MAVKKTVLVTGTSKGGVGDHLAREFHRRGYRVFATARTPSKVAHLQELGIEIVLLEVTDSASIKKAAEEVHALTGGKLDLLVNNSGLGQTAPLIESSIADARALFDVNVWGLLEVIQTFSPLLIASKGTIVNIGSVVSRIPIPFQGIYNASKAAVENISRQLRVELAAFEVNVIHVQLGGVETHFFDNAGKTRLSENSPYQPARDVIEGWLNADAQPKMDRITPEAAAKGIVDNAVSSSPSACQWIGGGAFGGWFISKMLWYTATDIALKFVGFPNIRKAMLGSRKTQ